MVFEKAAKKTDERPATTLPKLVAREKHRNPFAGEKNSIDPRHFFDIPAAKGGKHRERNARGADRWDPAIVGGAR